MECCGEIKENLNDSSAAEKIRSVAGLLLLLIGIYIAAYSGHQGEGFGYLLIMGSPFLILTGEKNTQR